MMTESGEELKLVGGWQVFNGYENSEHLGKTKAAKVTNQVANKFGGWSRFLFTQTKLILVRYS